MKYLNTNACKVLMCVRDEENNRGMTPARGMTRQAIYNKCQNVLGKDKALSLSTVTRALKLLKEEELIDEGIKAVNFKTYYITDKGLLYLREILGKR